MKDKYYTPSIEEFYVGFEYEQASMKMVAPKEWSKKIFYLNNSHIDIVKYGDIDKNTRVKYLDKEDVESVGFKEEKNNIFKFKDKYRRNWQLKLLIPDRGRILLSNDCKYFMDINIKNKSEFKVILKQLNIK
ncbi:hypothetical protein [Clostridium sp.]|jgi:hypothetical protein|uniref:hypothetical protein n=1 Tax=Clostridium sp. TaxID=1506 RepID=UPI003EED34EC